MRCLGRNMDNHCCWLQGTVCKYLEEGTEPGYRWSCGLRRELGSWTAVLKDSRYKQDVEPLLPPGIDCKNYPTKDVPCNYCGGGKVDGNS